MGNYSNWAIDARLDRGLRCRIASSVRRSPQAGTDRTSALGTRVPPSSSGLFAVRSELAPHEDQAASRRDHQVAHRDRRIRRDHGRRTAAGPYHPAARRCGLRKDGASRCRSWSRVRSGNGRRGSSSPSRSRRARSSPTRPRSDGTFPCSRSGSSSSWTRASPPRSSRPGSSTWPACSGCSKPRRGRFTPRASCSTASMSCCRFSMTRSRSAVRSIAFETGSCAPDSPASSRRRSTAPRATSASASCSSWSTAWSSCGSRSLTGRSSARCAS